MINGFDHRVNCRHFVRSLQHEIFFSIFFFFSLCFCLLGCHKFCCICYCLPDDRMESWGGRRNWLSGDLYYFSFVNHPVSSNIGVSYIALRDIFTNAMTHKMNRTSETAGRLGEWLVFSSFLWWTESSEGKKKKKKPKKKQEKEKIVIRTRERERESGKNWIKTRRTQVGSGRWVELSGILWKSSVILHPNFWRMRKCCCSCCCCCCCCAFIPYH